MYFILLISVYLLGKASGHGMLLEPPNRSSLWRYNPHAPVNYDDDQNYCGGKDFQWDNFNGKCGICGDPYNAPHPQDNENTGKYGKGIIAAVYNSSSVIPITVLLTTNHMGYFNFSLCVLENPNKPEPGEECFQTILLADGSEKYVLPNKEELDDYTVHTSLQLPSGLTCDRCVLRWNYNAGNNWGQCENGSWNEGCGPQETFRSCSDIRIE